MIKIDIQGNSIEFRFTDSQHYLENGIIVVPVNSLSMVIDDSDMVTLRRADSNDLLFSVGIWEFGMTKESLMNLYKTSMVGVTGSGGGSGADLSNYYTKSQVDMKLDMKQDDLFVEDTVLVVE